MGQAIATAKQLYASAGLKLEAELGFYLDRGFVFSGPDRLLLCNPGVSDDPAKIATPGEADCWFVRLAVGPGALRWFLQQMPWYLPKVAWYRNFKNPGGPLHVWDTNRLVKLLR